MKRMLLVGLLVAVCNGTLYADAKRRVAEFPGVPWKEMRVEVTPREARITDAGGRRLFTITPSPRTASLEGLVLMPRDDRLEVDARVPMKRGLRRLVMRGHPRDCDFLFGKPCTHLADWYGSDGSELNMYLEGHDADVRSYYYDERPCPLAGRRRVLSQLASPPAATKGFAFRYDIMKFGDGRFAYYGTRAAPLEYLQPERPPLPKHPPELVFHATFDGSSEAAFARGDPKPTRACGLAYAPGRKGQAVRMSAKSRSALAYRTDGNLDLRQGTVSLWVRLEWPKDGQTAWRSMVGFPESGRITGNGQFWLWWWGRNLRFDAADDTRHANWVQPPIDGEWRYVVASWDDERFRVWLDGECALDSARYNPSTTSGPMAAVLRRSTFDYFTYDRVPTDVFYVGCIKDGRQMDGLIDELKVWNAPMQEEEVKALCEKEGCRPVQGKGSTSASRAAPPDYAALFVGDGANPYERRSGGPDLELVETIRLDEASVAKLSEMNRFRCVGKVAYRRLGDATYLECGARENDRFAIRFAVDPKYPLYCIDIDYPDDAKRTADILVQGAQTTQWDGCTGADYALQVGYACGDEYPSSGKMRTHRCLYWTSDSDVALIVTTARDGVPAAVGEVRVYRVKDARLPSLKVNEPPEKDGWRRTLGLYYEDLAIGYDFATRRTSGRELDELSTMIDRAAAYMKYCGQNIMFYPGVWYDGLVGEGNYNPREHAERYLEAWYVKFAKEGLYFVPTINPDNMAVAPGVVTRKTMDDGSLNSSPIAILSTGRPNWGGRCNTPPNFCFGHPDVRREIERQIDVLLEQGAPYPSFKGICMHMTMHNMLWWGDISSGYNDYVIDAFERDTGIRVPRSTTALRARAHAQWLRDNVCEAWTQWRCDQVTAFYARMAEKIRARRPDLKLWLNSFVQPDFTRPGFVNEDFMEHQAREAGLDKKALAAIPNLAVCQTALPAFCRKRDRSLFPNDAAYSYNRVLQLKKGYFALLDGARFPWINQHDLYWENPVGREPGGLSCDWLKECPWHVTTINPGGVHALRDFVAPLRHRDVLGMSKGGFLVGTYGMEEHLRAFAAAYRALPAVVMKEIGRQGNVVLRQADLDGKSYFYLVNTDYVRADVALSVPDGTRNLVTGASLSGNVTLALAPYQLMSFAAPATSLTPSLAGTDAAGLMFHVPFDGSPVASVAKGNAKPQIVRGLEYAPGVDGQAVRLTAKAKSVLQYALAGNVLPEKGTVSLWVKREWPDTGRDASGNERWRTMFSFPQPCKDFGSGALSLWWWAERLRIDITDYGHTHVFRNDVPPPDGKWEHVVFTWDERAKEAKLYHNGRRYRHVSDNIGPMAAVISRKVGAPFTFDRPGFDRFFVGCLGDGRQFDGLVDDFRIYAEALSDAEVAALFSEHSQLAEPPQERPDYAALFAKDGPNPHEGGENLDLDFVAEYRFDAESMARYRRERRFRSVGDVSEKSLGGVPYLEAGTNLNDRFAFMFDVDPSVPLYCFDFVYPDDAKRTCDLLVQFKETHGDDYTLQVGYFTGDEYPNTGKMLTHRCLYWTTPGRGELAMIAMTARAGVPAALAALRVHKVKDAKLPPLAVREPTPAGGWRRMFGMCWEDPAIGYDFGTGGHGVKEISALIDRTAAYMKYCGQNVFCYPGVWYKGLIGEDYNPRSHAPDFLSAWYEKFDKEGLFFVPNVNANNMEIPAGLVTMDTITNGALHASPVAIHDTGKPNWGGWHNSPPNFNFFHPDVQAQIERHIDALLDQGAAHPSFKGVCMYLTMHSMNWFGDIRSGYNDYAVRAFARDRGLDIPIDERDPLRGRASAKWILANARDAWVQWRCDQVTRFYTRMAEKLRTRRPDLKLWLNSFVQPDWNWPDFMEDGFMTRQAREGGLDRAALAAIPNLILCQTQLPAFCRKRDRKLFPNDETYAFNRVLQTKPGFFSLVKDARFPWINQHDLYWENPVGREKGALNGDGFVETKWRVTTINPSGYHALRDFVLPLRFGDVLGISKGGYLVGTYGMEEHLRAFAAAYRALPAVVMKEIGRKGNVVLRQADYDGKSYFYLVNTDYAQANVVLSVPDGTRNLVTGTSLSGNVKLTLAPYQLMSFSAPSGDPELLGPFKIERESHN